MVTGSGFDLIQNAIMRVQASADEWSGMTPTEVWIHLSLSLSFSFSASLFHYLSTAGSVSGYMSIKPQSLQLSPKSKP